MTPHDHDENRPFEDAPLWIDPAATDAAATDAAPTAEASKEQQENAKPTLDGEPSAHQPVEDGGPGTWEGTRAQLRERFPDTKDGVLFCVFKLQENPEVGLRDFRDEAKLRGVPVSGRSLHSAKVLLGMAEPATRRTKKMAEPDAVEEAAAPAKGPAPSRSAPSRSGPSRSARSTSPRSGAPRAGTPRQGATRDRVGAAGVGSLENQLTQALQDIQSRANADADRLRDAIAQAIEVLQAALDDSEV